MKACYPITAPVLAALALGACGGGGGSSTTTTVAPRLAPPSSTLVRVSEASPYPASCGGALSGSTSYEDAEVEPYVAVNPTNPSNIIGIWQQDRWSDGGAHGLVAGYSMDDGKTWKETPLLFSTCAGGGGHGGNYSRASDPWVTFSPDGTAYAISISFDGVSLEPGSDGSVLVVRSADGGATWSDPQTLIFSGDTAFNDKESITADPKDSHFVYAVWDQLTVSGFGAAHFARTILGGTKWEAEKIIYDPGPNNQTIGNEIVGLSDGSAIVDLFEEIDGTNSNNAVGTIRVTRSTDHGATWSAPITVAGNFAVGTVDPDTGQPLRVGAGLPQMTAGPGNELVVVWQDGRFSNGDHDGIALSRSNDGGLSWTAPVEINADTSVSAFTPSVAVLADGTIGVSYFDLRANTPDPNTLPVEYWFTSSTDEVHWHEKHITGPFDMDLAPEAEGLFVGDYQAMGVIGGVFVPFFVQTNDAGTADRNDAYFRPPSPMPLTLSRRVSNMAIEPGNGQPGDAFRHKVHENLMHLMHNEVPDWDAIRAARNGVTVPP